MQFLGAFLFLSSAALAADTPEWTIENFQRPCAADSQTCTFTFAIDTNDGSAATPCTYDVTGSPAAHAHSAIETCGNFTVASGWNDDGANSFTTLYIAAKYADQVIYPSYMDTELDGGHVVKPDKSYPPTTLPGA